MLLVAFLVLLWTSCVVEFAFPSPDAANGWSLWGLAYSSWTNLRFTALCVFTLIVLVHLMLQWNWICVFVTSRMSKRIGRRIVVGRAARTLYGVSALILVFAMLGTSLYPRGYSF